VTKAKKWMQFYLHLCDASVHNVAAAQSAPASYARCIRNGMCAKNSTYMYVAWTSISRMITACEFLLLLAATLAVCACRSGPSIAAQTDVKS